MSRRNNPALDLAFDSWRLGLEAWSVIALRTAGALAGGPDQAKEASLMLTEKAKALIDAQFLIAGAVMDGKPHLAPQRALTMYRRRVQANRRRLSR